jgi:hypothetical protein
MLIARAVVEVGGDALSVCGILTDRLESVVVALLLLDFALPGEVKNSKPLLFQQ